jgi:hypothetical protein
MDYEKDRSAGDDISYVSEPAVAYGVRDGVAGEPWLAKVAPPCGGVVYDDFYGEGGSGSGDWLEEAIKDPRFLAMLDRDIAKAEADIEAGRFIPHEVVARQTERFLETGVWEDLGEEYKWVFTE